MDAPFGATLALTVTLAAGGFLFLMSAVWVVHPPHPLPGILAAGGDQNQHTKTALYLCTYGLILPIALVMASRVVDVIAGGPNRRGLGALVGVLSASLATAILLVRLSGVFAGHGGTRVLLPVVVVWGAGTLALLWRATRPRAWDRLLAIAGWAPWLALATGVLLLGVVLCVTALQSIALLPLVLGGAAVGGIIYAYGRRSLPRLSGREGAGVDLVAAAILFLAVPNLLIFATGPTIPSWFTTSGIVQLHHDFVLGFVNRVLHGGVLMVNSPPSQYGVGSVYFYAGWFHIAPIGYGTYGFMDGLLTALYYVAAFCIVRMAGVRRPLAIGAFALAVVALVYNLQFPPGDIPQQGPLRFGMPMLLLVAMVAAVRFPRRERLARGAALAVLGIASLWALEAAVYTLFAYVAIVCLECALLPAGTRVRGLVRGLLLGAAAVVAAQVLFALATLIAGGALPDWGEYWAYLHAFLFGGVVGSITYGFTRWSPGVAVGALYLASAAAIVLLVLRRPQLALRERVLVTALTGSTAYGIALFSYFDNRSATYLLLYVALPALITATMWLSFALRSSSGLARPARLGALAFALCLALLLVTTAWPAIGGRFARTPLAEAFPGGHGLRADLRRLWHPPPIDPRAPAGQSLLARFMPGQKKVLIATSPGLGTEILLRSQKANLLPIADPIEQSFVLPTGLGAIGKAIGKLHAGQRMLLDTTTWATVQAIRAHPNADPLKEFYGSLQTPLQGWELQQIERRFTLKPIHRDGQGFIVAELAPKS
ncbi:MAG TPA: hypothetical protein VGF74_10695 [Thermoleophilaceae bacterium]